MDKWATQILDFNDSLAVDGEKAFSDPVLSKLFKSAEIPISENLEKLGNDDFALIIRTKDASYRKFPINTKEATVASCLMFLKNAEKLPDEAKQITAFNLYKAASAFDILNKFGTDLKKILKNNEFDNVPTNIYKESDNKKEPIASKTENYALIYKSANGEEIKKYSLDTEDLIKTAIERFGEITEPFKEDPIYIRQIGYRIAKRAEEKNIKISNNHPIMKYSSDVYSPMLKIAIDERKRNAPDKEIEKLYDDLFDKRASLEPICFCRVLEVLDKKAGVNKLWGKLGNPYYVVLGSPREIELIKDSTSRTVNEKLISLSRDMKKMGTFRKSLSKIADNFVNDPVKTFNSLSLNERSLIASWL